MLKLKIKKLSRYLSIFLFLNFYIPQVKSASALAAWALKSNGFLELRTRTDSKLKAYFQKGDNIYGDRFWIDFQGELKTPRTIKGNGPVKEIRLGKPNNGKTRLVVEFSSENNLNPLAWRLVGIDENRWRIKLFSPKKSFRKISEGSIYKSNNKILSRKKSVEFSKRSPSYLRLPDVKQNKFYVVIDPGHGGPDPGAIGIRGIRETDIVLDVSRKVQKLLSEKGVKVILTRKNEVDLDLPPRVLLANKTNADIFVSIHANASRGKRRDINGLETFYYSGWKGRLLAKRIQKQILKVSPGSPDRGVKQGRFFVIKNTRMPAVLVEVGFLTGRLDARRLEKSSYRTKIAYAIAKGILEYLSKTG